MYMFLAMGARATGDVRMTEMYALELERVADSRAPRPEFVSGAEANRAWVALRRGNFDEAAHRAERALEVWQRDAACSQSVWLMAWPALSCAMARGEVGQAIEYGALMTRADQQALGGDLDLRLQRVLTRYRDGDAEEAKALLSQLEREAREYGYT
jgi:tetratricopeptide (TPR) repeat protein